MHWLLVDETNRPPKPGQFFIYGGLVLPAESISVVHGKVQELREQFGLKATDDLKFSNQRGMSTEVNKSIKIALLAMLASCGVKFVATAVLQQVLTKDDAKAMSWAINSVTGTFYKYLEKEQSHGAVFIDRVDKQKVNGTLRDMAGSFQLGLNYQDGRNKPMNDRIVMFGMTSNNASHLSSCADVALGTFGHCVNAATGHNGATKETAAELMPLVDKLFWREEKAGLIYNPSGLLLWPVESTHYPQEYRNLRSNLGQLSKGEVT